MRTQRVGDVDVIRDFVEIPGFGALPINAFVVHADEPVLVDTGRPVEREAFMSALSSVIDPAEIKWIWLTHPDRDHTGSLFQALDAAPNARLVSTFFAVGYMTVEFEMPMDRLYLLNPGQALDVGGGRKLHAFRPPLYDSPMTVGFFDDGTGTCISSDCFGALMPSAEAADIDDVSALAPEELHAYQLTWAGADSPWVANMDPAAFATTYEELRRFAPRTVLGTHVPPAVDSFDQYLGMLADAPKSAQPFVGPDQAMMEAMMSGAGPG